MPTYEYKCEDCGVVFERFQHFAEEPVRCCPECGCSVRRVIHPVGIVFKGKGFYVTDNRGSTSSLMPKAESEGESSTDSSSDAGEKVEKPAKAEKREAKASSDTSD